MKLEHREVVGALWIVDWVGVQGGIGEVREGSEWLEAAAAAAAAAASSSRAYIATHGGTAHIRQILHAKTFLQPHVRKYTSPHATSPAAPLPPSPRVDNEQRRRQQRRGGGVY